MMINAIKAGIKAAREQAESDRAKQMAIVLKSVVSEYLDSLPEEKAARVINRIIGAEGLTAGQIKRFIDAANGDRNIEIHFGNGDTALITNRERQGKGGPGW